MESPLMSRCILMIGLWFASLPVLAVEPKSADAGSAMKKAQGLIRQLSQEKTVLEAEKTAWLAEKAKVEQEKLAMEAKLKILSMEISKLQSLQAEVVRYKQSMETLKSGYDKQLEQERNKEQNLVQKHNGMIMKANAIFADNQLLVQAVRERETWISQCTISNQKLRTAFSELLDHYRQRDNGFLQQLTELEPLTGLGEMATENTLEEYRYQLKHLQITPFQANGNDMLNKSQTLATPAATQPVGTDVDAETGNADHSSVPKP
jgi:hypothetical protein